MTSDEARKIILTTETLYPRIWNAFREWCQVQADIDYRDYTTLGAVCDNHIEIYGLSYNTERASTISVLFPITEFYDYLDRENTKTSSALDTSSQPPNKG